MKRDPVTIDETYSVKEAAQMMIDFALDTLIVTCMGRILGAITYREILRHLLVPGFNEDDTIIGEITDKDVILVRPNTTLEDAIKLMLEMDRNTLPVVDSEVVGYISYTDILRLVNRIEATPIEEEEFDPKKYII
jgi:CBS domain-containing protein